MGTEFNDSIPEPFISPIKSNNSYGQIYNTDRSFIQENNDRNTLRTRQGTYDRNVNAIDTYNAGTQNDLDKSRKADEKKQRKALEKEEKQIKAAEKAAEKEEIRRLEQANKPARVLLTETQKKENRKQAQLRSKFKKQMNGI
jgi:hydroxylamine reductase (hybrid-cluster protein)